MGPSDPIDAGWVHIIERIIAFLSALAEDERQRIVKRANEWPESRQGSWNPIWAQAEAQRAPTQGSREPPIWRVRALVPLPGPTLCTMRQSSACVRIRRRSRIEGPIAGEWRR
jgi:hypothetical protein